MPTSRSRIRNLAKAFRAARGNRPVPQPTVSPNGAQVWTRV